jgi:hypothetical protein
MSPTGLIHRGLPTAAVFQKDTIFSGFHGDFMGILSFHVVIFVLFFSEDWSPNTANLLDLMFFGLPGLST